MKVIGVDPGSRFTGYGIVQKQGSNLIHLDCGVIIPGAKLPLSDRLAYIHKKLVEIVETFKPDAAAVEDVFFAHNWRTALKLGQARGAALAALGGAGLQVNTYAPTRVKQSVVGHGRAKKAQVQQMVKMLLGLPEIPEENSADALAMAICHLHSLPVNWQEHFK